MENVARGDQIRCKKLNGRLSYIRALGQLYKYVILNATSLCSSGKYSLTENSYTLPFLPIKFTPGRDGSVAGDAVILTDPFEKMTAHRSLWVGLQQREDGKKQSFELFPYQSAVRITATVGYLNRMHHVSPPPFLL